LQTEDDFDEYSFEMMANLIIDSPNIERVETATKLFKKHIQNEQMTSSLLLHAISTLLLLPDIESIIDRKSKLLPDYPFFGEKVLSQIRTEIAVPYFIRNILSSKEEALMLLRFSASNKCKEETRLVKTSLKTISIQYLLTVFFQILIFHNFQQVYQQTHRS
jgi:hypothetical protein